MIEAVIFDVDGTLVDSVDAHAETWRLAFARFGHDVSFEAVRGQIGKGGDQLMPVFLLPDEVERSGKDIERLRGDLFKQRFLPDIRAIPGARSLFLHLRELGLGIALASSAKADELGAYTRIADIADLVDIETSSEDAAKSKPHPDIFQAALDKLGMPPDRTIVVGDTPYDAEAARKAGIPSIGVLTGGFAGDDIRRAGASQVFRDLEDMLARRDDWLPDSAERRTPG